MACGFAIRSQIIWAKERLVLSRGDFHWQHEPCWYAVREKGKAHWNGDRKQTTLWQIPSRDQDAATVHGTQKPFEAMRRPMLNNSAPGQPVYEPFSGSGTSIIAAETCGRIWTPRFTSLARDLHDSLRWSGERRRGWRGSLGFLISTSGCGG
jgi:DNA modification methylase